MRPFGTVDHPDLNKLHEHGNPELEKIILHHMPDLTRIQNVARAMKQLGDPSRLRIFWLLCHTQECVSDISLLVGMSAPAVSHHLKLLKNAGLLVTRRVGKEVIYQAADTDLVHELHKAIETVAKITCPD
mgnify:FL=1